MKPGLIFILLFIATTMTFGQHTIPCEIRDGGYIVVEVHISRGITGKFMLDTGAGINCISQNLFEKIRETTTELGLHTGTRHNGEQITGILYEIPSVQIGTFEKQSVAVGVIDNLNNYDGLLSMDLFRDNAFTIDFVRHELIIYDNNIDDKRKRGISIPIFLKKKGAYELDFFVDICLNDAVTCRAEFDTGAGFNMLMLHPKYMALLAIKQDTSHTNYGYYKYSTTLPSLSYCGDDDLKDNNVFVGFKEGLIFDGLVGSGLFKNKRITIDIPHSAMIVN